VLLIAGSASERSRSAALLDEVSVRLRGRAVVKAAYSGVLKVLLDLLPQTALRQKVVLPIATGGSHHHMLALDYALRPVLQSLAARHILPGVYATDSQITLMPEGSRYVSIELGERLDHAVGALLHEIQRTPPPPAGFEAVPFSQVRCSV
ncbi:MAG TPA: NAD(P)H-dependent oxidoreductase, partial [Chloroflexota bacterium]|nr:NAD(P)H-dependent oxidoreductase [Chloroflexota bacterium]